MKADEEQANWFTPEVTDALLPSPCPAGYGRYRDFEDIARGGGATIRSALDPNLGRRVAIKTILPELADDELLQRRFLREARVTAMIQHPATVPVYEIARDDQGRAYFAMKRVQGSSLRKIIDGVVGRLPAYESFRPRDALIDIIVQTGQALAYAHRHGIVHRDVKPDNITVGDFGEVLVMDWGVAKVMGEPEVQQEDDAAELADGPADLTLQGKVYGTPRYMSPEQARGALDIDPRSDIFSLGAVLYEVITHRPLVWGMDRLEVMRKICDIPFEPPSRREPLRMIPRELDEVCMKALEKDRHRRYQHMTDFVEDLQRFRRGETVSVSQDTPWQRFRRWQRRVLPMPQSLLVLAAGILIGYLTWHTAAGR